MDLQFSNLGEMIESRAGDSKDKTVLRFYDRDISYGELNEMSSRIALGLYNMGIRKGDRVCIMMDNSPEYYYAYLGINRLGAIAGPVNCWWQSEEIRYLINDSGAVAIFVDEVYREQITRIMEATPDLNQVILHGGDDGAFHSFSDLLETEGPCPDAEINTEDVSTIVYTSGTTGNPKGVLLTHGNILTNSFQAGKLADIHDDDVVMCFLPLFHVNGLVITGTAPMCAGAQIVLRKNFSASEFWECVSRYRVSIFSGVPTVYQILLGNGAGEDIDVSSLRYGVCGAAPMPVETIRSFEERFNMIIIEGYGLTEATAGATANPIEGERKIGSIGIPFEDSEIKLFDDEDNEVPQGEVGEIVIRGGNVMKGYFNRPDETADTLKNGWLHTGDMAYMDSDGYLFIVDRKKEMIIRGGENIYPKELEEIMFRHPAVQEVAVIGMPDRIYGEEVLACIVLREGESLTGEEFIEWCGENMASYKVPRFVEIRESLPKNILGKLLKKELKNLLKKEGKLQAV